MKVLIGLFLVWILARHEFGEYLALATENPAKPQ